MAASETGKKILIVDDEPDVVTFLSTFLEDHGYQTINAPNGEEGLNQTKKEKPDLITLDITMPEKSGVRMYRDLKEDDSLASIPVIIVTGVAQEFKQFIHSRKQVPPPEGYLSKPIDKDELLKTIEKLIA